MRRTGKKRMTGNAREDYFLCLECLLDLLEGVEKRNRARSVLIEMLDPFRVIQPFPPSNLPAILCPG